ncbi:KilA-N domain-containing protein [Xenorhabdus ehlersii]
MSTITESDNMNNVANKNLPVIAGVEITTDSAGRFNLNALHKASGTGSNKAPAQWLRTQSAKELVSELESNLLKGSHCANMHTGHKVLNAVLGGTNPGTFAHELIAVSYAGWINPSFQLQVNQTFIDYRSGKLVERVHVQIPQSLPEALRLAADLAEQKAALEHKVESMENLFKEGMTATQFCKMLNGVNVQKVNHFLHLHNWLYNESKSGKNLRWRATSYARDRYLTEKQNEFNLHGEEAFIKFQPVLLQKGAQKIYQHYLANELPMKKNWDGLHTHDKSVSVAA